MAPRVTIAVAAVIGAAVLGAASSAAATDATSVVGAVGKSGWVVAVLLSAGGVGLLVLSVTVAGPRPIGPALAMLGAAWLVGIPAAGGLRPFTPLAGAWLLAVGELAYWSLDLRIAGREARVVGLRRGATIALLAGGSSAIAAVPELGLSWTPTAGLALTAFGLLAVVSLVAVAAALAWRLGPAFHFRTRGNHPPSR